MLLVSISANATVIRTIMENSSCRPQVTLTGPFVSGQAIEETLPTGVFPENFPDFVA